MNSPISASEWKRKLVHAGMGAFALTLRWVPWGLAAAGAAAALLFNLFVIPRIGRSLYRDPSRRRDPGIVAYPAVVLALLLLFRNHLPVAAAAWGMLALGDPAATIAGRLVGGPRLPWNRGKTWIGLVSYIVYGSVAAVFLYDWVWARGHLGLYDIVGVVLPAVALGAALESLPAGIDDNWIPAIPAGLVLFAGLYGTIYFWQASDDARRLALAAAVNAAIGLVTGFLRVVSPSGAWAGALAGTAILYCGGARYYAMLWAFFLAGTAVTKWGYARKAARGTAQEAGGRRGARHVAANGGVALLLALLVHFDYADMPGVLSVAFAGAFAAALADTCGTEFGSLHSRRAVSLSRLSAVPAGTKGAVSAAGTAAGAAGAFALAALGVALRLFGWRAAAAVAAGGVAGSLSESLLLDVAARRKIAPDHEFVNAFNTFVGAVVALEIVLSLRAGRPYLPVETLPGRLL